MFALYWFALIVGAGLLLLSLFGDILGHGDVDAGGIDGHGDSEGFRILSMRNATYFLFAFGATGLLVGWAFGGLHPVATAVVATLLALAAGGISGAVFGWIGRTESGHMPDDRGWVGRIAEVVLPVPAVGTGKILVTRDGREHELLARPFDREPESPEQWKSVMIMDLENGVALVSPVQGSLEDPATLRITPSTES